MQRRTFIAGLGAAASSVLSPGITRAQRSTLPIVGSLFVGSRENSFEADFRKGLSEMGFVDGRNVAIEYHYADNQYERLPALAAELVRRRVSVIYAEGGPLAVSAAKVATAIIPIIFLIGIDPVEGGLVASFNRPGANVTGISFMNLALTAKRFGLLHDMVPYASRFALLVNPDNPGVASSLTAAARTAAGVLGKQIEVFTASTNDQIDLAFASMQQHASEALLIGTGPLFSGRGQPRIAALALRHALPAIHSVRGFTDIGGLMSYGASLADSRRQAGIYVGRVLKGEKPADLPVMQPTRFEFVINLASARAIGIDVPPMLLALADDVIE